MAEPRTPATGGGWRDVLRALDWLRPHARAELGLVALLAVGTALSLVYPWLLGQVLDQVFARGRHELLAPLAIGIAASAVVGAALSSAASYLQIHIATRVLVELRTTVYAHLQRLDLDDLQGMRLGDLLARLGGDLNEVQQVATATVVPLAGATLTLVGASGLLLWLSPTLFAVALLFLPPAYLLVRLLRPRVRRLASAVRERNAELGSQLVESLGELRHVRASATEALERSRFRRHNEALAGSVLAFQRTAVAQTAAGQALVAAAGVAILLVGAELVRDGALTVGELVAFALYQARLFGPVRSLTSLYMGIQRAAASLRRVFELLERPAARPVSADAPPTPGEVLGAVAFEGVSFTYPGRAPVLDDVSFAVPAGGSLAIVGPSGVGKTTVVELLLGLREPTAGAVLLDGRALAERDPAEVLPRFALVSQRPVVWSTSVRENLAYGLGALPDDALWDALGAVELAAVVRSMPAGLDTPLGERGVRLSEGQRQRLGLAHALLRRPAVLVLDEVSAALDVPSERAVAGLLAALDGVTRILVTHRLTLAATADTIAVLDAGRIVEIGSHAQLLAADGPYRALVDAGRGPASPG